MFTCDFETQCIKDEKLARKKYLGNSKGIKLVFKTFLWVIFHEPKWKRNIDICHSGCDRWNQYHIEHFSKSLTPEVIKNLKEIDENTTHDKYLI